MPNIFYATSGWVTARRSRAVTLAVVLLASMLAFGWLVGSLSINGPSPVAWEALVITAWMLLCFWITLVVVWFDPRIKPSRSGFGDWLHAVALDFFLIFAATLLSITARRVMWP